MTENQTGIALFKHKSYPPRPCAICKEPIDAPQRNQTMHQGECKREDNRRKQARFKARQRKAKA